MRSRYLKGKRTQKEEFFKRNCHLIWENVIVFFIHVFLVNYSPSSFGVQENISLFYGFVHHSYLDASKYFFLRFYLFIIILFFSFQFCCSVVVSHAYVQLLSIWTFIVFHFDICVSFPVKFKGMHVFYIFSRQMTAFKQFCRNMKSET